MFSIRSYRDDDLGPCRALWAALVEHHRRLYADPAIGGEQPGLHFDRHLARCGPGRLWLAIGPDGAVAGLVGLLVGGSEAEVEPIVVAPGNWQPGPELGGRRFAI